MAIKINGNLKRTISAHTSLGNKHFQDFMKNKSSKSYEKFSYHNLVRTKTENMNRKLTRSEKRAIFKKVSA